MSLRARVDDFCKTATGLGKKIETLEFEIKTLKEKLNAAKTVKAKPTSVPKKTRKVKIVEPVAKPTSVPKKTRKVKIVEPVAKPISQPKKTTRRKMTDEEKAQRKREREAAKMAANNAPPVPAVPVAPMM